MAIDELAHIVYIVSLAMSYRNIPGLIQVKLSWHYLWDYVYDYLQKSFQILSFSLIRKLLYLIILLTCIIWAD